MAPIKYILEFVLLEPAVFFVSVFGFGGNLALISLPAIVANFTSLSHDNLGLPSLVDIKSLLICDSSTGTPLLK